MKTAATSFLSFLLCFPILTHAFLSPALGVPVAQRSKSSLLFSTSEQQQQPRASNQFTRDDLIGKEFQLEEREDKETSITEIWLQGDGTVTFGVTDGPAVEKSWGIWTLQQNGQFWMEIIRTFASSEERVGAHQIGPVHYQVKREFVGSLERIGGNVMTVKGTIHGDDESTGANLDCEVGYFSLIDEATEFDKLSP